MVFQGQTVSTKRYFKVERQIMISVLVQGLLKSLKGGSCRPGSLTCLQSIPSFFDFLCRIGFAPGRKPISIACHSALMLGCVRKDDQSLLYQRLWITFERGVDCVVRCSQSSSGLERDVIVDRGNPDALKPRLNSIIVRV